MSMGVSLRSSLAGLCRADLTNGMWTDLHTRTHARAHTHTHTCIESTQSCTHTWTHMHTHVIHPSIHLSINPSIHPSVCCLHSLDLVGKSQNVHDYVISCTVASCYRIIQSHFRGSPQSRLCTCSVPTTGSAGCYRESPVCMPLLNPPPLRRLPLPLTGWAGPSTISRTIMVRNLASLHLVVLCPQLGWDIQYRRTYVLYVLYGRCHRRCVSTVA